VRRIHLHDCRNDNEHEPQRLSEALDGPHRNGWLSNATLSFSLVLFLVLAVNEIVTAG
jgi:hypothetical protein